MYSIIKYYAINKLNTIQIKNSDSSGFEEIKSHIEDGSFLKVWNQFTINQSLMKITETFTDQ